jgi:hypothetical protein
VVKAKRSITADDDVLGHMLYFGVHGSFIIWELVWMQADVIRFGIVETLDSFDGRSPTQHCLGDTVHAIHDAGIRGENDGKVLTMWVLVNRGL